jgi:predicted flap endonuclease-1-like 5' DNA nuclease
MITLNDFELQFIGVFVIVLLTGFFVGWRWSRFFYKRALVENDSYWKDEIKKLNCASFEDNYEEPYMKVKLDKVAQKDSLKAELSKLNYLNEPVKKENLQFIQGVGKVLEETLNDLGVYGFSQVAAWNYEVIPKLDEYLNFQGRIQREKWVEQAQLLAKGETTEFAKRVQNGEVPTSESR